jgi:hypothetical protein
VCGNIPPITLDPFFTISANDIGFGRIDVGIKVRVEIRVEVEAEVEAEVKLFPTIFCIWVDI